MGYLYRWYFVALLTGALLLVGYYYDINPMLHDIQQLKISETKLEQNLIELKVNPYLKTKINNQVAGVKNANNNITEKNAATNDFLADLQAAGLELKSSRFSRSSEIANKVMTHLVLRGNYQYLFLWISQLHQKSEMVKIMRFITKRTDNNDLLIEMDVLISPIKFKIIKNKYNYLIQLQQPNSFYNPFCSSANVDQWGEQSINNAALMFSLESIKMIGYLQFGEHRQALMLLPNTMMRTIEKDFLLGSEQGRVVTVDRNQTTIKLSDGRLVKLKLK